MPLPSPYLSIEEKQMRSARVGSQQWEFERIFRVITREDQPPLGPIAAIQCPGIPALGTAYRDFISNEYVPWALLFDYDAQPVNNQYQWDIVCKYSTLERSPRNGGGLQSPPTPGMPNTGGGGSNPDDPTQLLPKVRTGVEVVKIPYFKDPQGLARFKDKDDGTLANFNFSRYMNTAGDRFSAGATLDYPMRTYLVSLYYTADRSPATHGYSVNNADWDGFTARTLLCKTWTTSRERFGTSWYWLHNFEFVYDPVYKHTFTLLNSGFRQLQTPIGANFPDNFPRKLIDIQTGPGIRTAVEWPLDFNGRMIDNPGNNQSNFIWAEFNKFKSSNFSTLPFTLTEFGLSR